MRIELPKNLDEVEVVDNREPLPPGEYAMQVVQYELKEGKKAPYIEWQLEVIENPEYQGRIIYHNTSLSEKAISMPSGIKAMLEATGTPWTANDFDPEPALGQTVLTETSQRPSNDPDSDRVFTDIEAIHPYA